MKRNFSKCNYQLINDYLTELDFSFLNKSNLSCSQKWSFFNNLITDTIAYYVPENKVMHATRKPHSDKYSKRIYNKYKRLCKKERKTNKDYTAEKKLIRRELSKSLHRYQEKLEESLLKPSNIKSFYKYVSCKMRKHKVAPSTLIYNAKTLFNDSEKVEAFNEYFSSVFGKFADGHIVLASGPQPLFVPNIVRTAILSSNPLSAPGPDNIPMLFWKNVGTVISPHLCSLFNLFISSDFLPSEW